MPTTIAVVNANDAGFGSLRAAITAAVGGDRIIFNIPVPVSTIAVGSTTGQPLPAVVAGVTIDGFSEGVFLGTPGYQGPPLIEINGASAGAGANGLTISGFDAIVGLAINGFDANGIEINGAINQVFGCYIGTTLDGLSAAPNTGAGIDIEASSNNTIGGSGVGQGNVISGNGASGIVIQQTGSFANIVHGNVIGLDATGESRLANQDSGISITSSGGNVVGGDSPGDGNVISGNKNAGVFITTFLSAPEMHEPAVSSGGFLQPGEYFYEVTATTADGETVASNPVSETTTAENATIDLHWAIRGGATGYKLYRGMAIGAVDTLVATLSGQDNFTFSDNGVAGTPGRPPDNNTAFSGPATANVVLGNLLGTDKLGTSPLGNVFSGINITFAAGTIIGGGTQGARNVISGNGGAPDSGNGIIVQGATSTGTIIFGNFIGTDITGTARLGNNANGIFIEHASNTTIGGGNPSVRNIISSNASADGFEGGISILDGSNNTIVGNFIGTDVTGEESLGNGFSGVIIGGGSQGNVVGGAGQGLGNVISGNGFGPFGPAPGIFLIDPNTTNNTIQGNFIGTDATGDLPLGNNLAGIVLGLQSSGNLIGGTAAGAGNLIRANVRVPSSGFFGDGIIVRASNDNTIQGNQIGDNEGNGINIFEASQGTIIGGVTSAAGNLISGNMANGILVQDPGSTGTKIQGNRIGVDALGIKADPNLGSGVVLQTNGGTTVGGLTPGAGNLISGNKRDGVEITGILAAPLLGLPSPLNNGALPAGTYFYVITALTAAGETTASVERSVTLDQVGRINLNWIADGGATGYKIYRGAAAHEENVLVATVDSGLTTSFDDVGGATTPGTPPLNNTAFVAGINPNTIQGNRIGTDVTGVLPIGNVFDGVDIVSSPGNVIGGTAPGARNVISGNGGLPDSGTGINLQGVLTSGTIIQGNFIGTDISGGLRLGNAANGIFLQGAINTTIGGTAPGAGNVISSNASADGGEAGITLIGHANHNTIQGNLIGTDSTGRVNLGNAGAGIILATGSAANTIGGNTSAARNVIAGNGFGPFGPAAGIMFNDAGTDGNTVAGNFIGVDVTGGTALGNSLAGVAIVGGPSSNTIGGTTAGAANVISGNSGETGSGLFGDGVIIRNASGNSVLGNRIGVDVSGLIALGNHGNGVYLFENADNNTIGKPEAGNLISGNQRNGVLIQDASSTGNLVADNVIGADATDSVALPNQGNGVMVASSPGNTIGGDNSTSTPTRTPGNVILGNQGAGIVVTSLLAPPLFGSPDELPGGNLAAGTYFYVMTATTATGETTASAERSITVTTDTSVSLGWVTIGGATGYKIYRGTSAGAENVLVTTITENSTTTFVDAGGPTTPGTPPQTNTALGSDASGNLLQGNRLGGGFGADNLGNGAGIVIIQSSHTMIGGVADGAGNEIFGNNGAGVTISGASASNNTVQGNYITSTFDQNGQPINTFNGVEFLSGASNNLVGGATNGAANNIQSNGGSGVLVSTGSNSDAILGNSISNNFKLGIELQHGANRNQAAPIITSAIDVQGDTFIQGQVTGPPNSAVTVQLFENFQSATDGPAQGDRFVAQVVVQTNAAGQSPFALEVPSEFLFGQTVTATATDALQDTSEFSAGVVVSDNPFADLTAAMYTQVLQRTPSVADINFWVGTLSSGVSRLVMSQIVWQSPEHRGIQVDGYYQQYLNRQADVAGKTMFVNELVAGASEGAVQFQFLISPEYANTHPTFDAYLIGLYQDVLGRAPDAAGVEFWRIQAILGATHADVAFGFLTSDENHINLLDGYYQEFLGRPIDPPSEMVLLAQLRAGTATPQSVAEMILASDEYFQLAQSQSGPIFG